MNFAPLSCLDYPKLAHYFRNQPYGLSAYSLSGIVAWNNCAYNNFYAVEGGALVIAESHISDPAALWIFMPLDGEREFSPAALAELAGRAGASEIRYVPADYAAKHSVELAEFFDMDEQPEYAEYIYLQQDLADLKGAKYSKKRNLIKQFEREYVAPWRTSVSPIKPENIQDALDFAERWHAERKGKYEVQPDQFLCEKKALSQTLENFGMIGVEGVGVYVDGKLSALGIASRLNKETGVLNFEKAFDSVKGLYQFLDKECALRLFSGCRYINKESALGDAGLKQAKESYHPVAVATSLRLKRK